MAALPKLRMYPGRGNGCVNWYERSWAQVAQWKPQTCHTLKSPLMDTVKDAIITAIRQGAPVYNQGKPQACCDIYTTTAAGIVESGIAPEFINDALRDAITNAAKQQTPNEAAWCMRRCFDDILDGKLEALASLPPVPEGAEEVMVLDFEGGLPVSPRWFSMDDGVMGGLSSSSLMWDRDSGSAVFQGNLTTANNGGFASVRCESWAGYMRLLKAKGIRLVVQGDGRTYKLNAKAEDGYDGIMYQHDFDTVEDGKWRTIDLPFAGFKPNFRGRVVPGRPPLAGSQVRQLGLMVSKFSDTGGLTAGFRTGPFRLALKSIRGFF